MKEYIDYAAGYTSQNVFLKVRVGGIWSFVQHGTPIFLNTIWKYKFIGTL